MGGVGGVREGVGGEREGEGRGRGRKREGEGEREREGEGEREREREGRGRGRGRGEGEGEGEVEGDERISSTSFSLPTCCCFICSSMRGVFTATGSWSFSRLLVELIQSKTFPTRLSNCSP